MLFNSFQFIIFFPIEAVQDVFDDYENKINLYFNFAMYHYRWKELTKEDFSPVYSPEKGAELLIGLESMDYTEPTPEHIEIQSTCATYVPKICDYCAKNGIKVLFTYIPSANGQEQIDIAASAEEWLKSYNCDYLNMNHKGIVNYHTDMYMDGGHLNFLGASKVTDYLGQYLMEHYELENHSVDPAYTDWVKEYLDYVAYKTQKFQEGKLYENLILCYGSDFEVTIEMNPESAYVFSYNQKAYEILTQLSEHAMIIPVEEMPEGIMNMTVRDLRSENYDIVFETEISEEVYLQ